MPNRSPSHRSRRPALVVCALVGILGGIGSYTFWQAQGASYFSNDPRACVNCHIMREQYDSWQKASHHAHATCVDCHLPPHGLAKWLAKAENGFWHSTRFTLQDFHEPIRIHDKNARVLQENCLRCHGALVADLAHHGAFADVSNHCVRCHAAVGHGAPR
ncbi:MAG: cytochrome c nitrite reductase small subunit [Gemmataceae bacterium]|nr:cytochrome c nitrite reductase small subunit [Gemmataceae bacterium]